MEYCYSSIVHLTQYFFSIGKSIAFHMYSVWVSWLKTFPIMQFLLVAADYYRDSITGKGRPAGVEFDERNRSQVNWNIIWGFELSILRMGFLLDGNAPYSLRCPLIYLVEQAMIQLVDGNLFFYKKALPPSVLSLSVWGWRVHSLYRIRQEGSKYLNLNHFFHYTTLASGHTGISSKPKQPLLFSLHKSLTRESSLRQPKEGCDD